MPQLAGATLLFVLALQEPRGIEARALTNWQPRGPGCELQIDERGTVRAVKRQRPSGQTITWRELQKEQQAKKQRRRK